MSDQEPARAAEQKGSFGPIFYVGAGALLLAMLVDAGAVIGRHVGIRIIGSIELVQALILLASSASLLAATLARKHATVHLLIERLQPAARAHIERAGAALAALFFVILAAGSVWIASDLWHGHEESEVLRIPYLPLRLAMIIALATAAVLLLWQMLRGIRK